MQVDCKQGLMEVHGLTSQDADAMIRELTGVERTKLKQYVDSQEAYHRSIEEAQAISRTRNKEVEGFIREELESEKGTWFTNFLKILTGVEGFKQSRIYSIGTLGKGLKLDREGRILAGMRLTDKELRQLFEDQAFVRDFSKELFPWSTKSKSGNKLAHKLATLVHKERMAQVLESRSYGVPILWRDDYLATTYHNHIQMKTKGKPYWTNRMMGYLDHEKTFGPGVTNKQQFLEKKFDHITKFADEMDFSTARQNKPLADVMSEHRELHFKDADSWLEYQREFGYQDPIRAIFQGMDVMDSKIALLRFLGSDPEKLFRKLLQEGIDGKKLNPLQKNQLISAYKTISGESFIVGNPTMAQLTDTVMSVQAMSKLGKATITSFNDIPNSALVLNTHGMGFYESYKRLFKSAQEMLSGMAPEEKTFVLKYLGSGFDGVIGAAAQRMMMLDTVPGKIHKMVSSYFNIIGLNQWTDFWRTAYSRVLSQYMADNINIGYKNLNPRFKKLLDAYDITPDLWGEMQKVGSYSLREILTDHPGGSVNAIKNADHRWVTSDWIRSKRKRAGDKIDRLADRIATMYSYEARTAVPEPGALERATFMRTFQRGTIMGSFAQLFTQFRTTQMVTAMRIYPRIAQMGLPSVLHLTPMLLVGYASLAVKDLLAGKQPSNPYDPEVLLESFATSGLSVYYGDIILGSLYDHHRDVDEVIGGPTYTTLKDTWEVIDLMWNDQEAGPQMWNLVRRNLLPMNVFYAELGLNYALNWQIQDYLNPGYAERLEDFARFQGNPYFEITEPTNFVPYGGMYGLGQ